MKNDLLKMYRSLIVIAFIGFLSSNATIAQTNTTDLTVVVTADKPDWIYKIGEIPKFKITATQNGVQAKNIKVYYEIGPEKMPAFKKYSLLLKNGEAIIDGFSLKESGFLRLTVTSKNKGK